MRPPITKKSAADRPATRLQPPVPGPAVATKPSSLAPRARATHPPAAPASPARIIVPKPVFRKLRVFGVDPEVAARFESALLNEMTLRIRWEALTPGPSGEYISVVDVDESGELVFPPLDLDRPDLLAQDGLPASDGNPAFRQQMVYAVIMRTIQNFERALGRPVHWAPRVARGKTVEYRRVLQVCPHYMHVENAYFDPEKGFCFGYFEAMDTSPFPGTIVFSALSQDIIAHELTHAILMGMNIEFNPGSNPDIPAFHEAFADLVPLFQHFWPSDVLGAQIAAVRGDLREPSPLGAVALQFGQALGRPDGIRNALGKTDVNGVWHARQPDPKAYKEITQPHDRGDILVGAVFDAFNKIYESRVADLKRIATRGSGILPQGTLHPDLVQHMTREAAHAAELVLEMCIRALDYLPPVDITFGDYLRAIITADCDLAWSKNHAYRVAFLDAFRRYGIFPHDVGTLSVETLLWPAPADDANVGIVGEFVAALSREHTYWTVPRDRKEQWLLVQTWKRGLRALLSRRRGGRPARLGTIDLAKPFEVATFDLRERQGAASSGAREAQWVIKIVQPPRATVRREARRKVTGCTLLVDADSGRVRYHIERATTAPPNAGGRSDVLARAGHARAVPPPAERRLRVFAFDPSLGVTLETSGINEVVLSVPWERDATGADLLTTGPVGEYVEVVDRDPASRCFYAPVDLNHPHLLAEEGLAPSESNPQFHQQMVYAVAMRTIRHFEVALGRVALWSAQRQQVDGPDGTVQARDDAFVPRLRLYPHALREANAYYSPAKKAILFGYFPAPAGDDRDSLARLTVFTCLSHDIIAHEVTHALLDGMHRRFSEPSNPDVLAFHEAFADLVALFQHFSLPDVLRHQIAASRGDLASQNRLGELAQQFGQAVGKRGALRSAIGSVDETTGEWTPSTPNPDDYRRLLEPHARGAILVAAVFDAFLTLYKNNVAGLLRIATEGTGVLPAGHLHPDLVNRLADEAAGVAARMLHMCIRALDFCPPVDITFGDYLRAMLTANFEHDPQDDERRSVAVVEAFRRYGIVPEDVRTLSVDGLLWRPTSAAPDEDENVVLAFVKAWVGDIAHWNLTKSRRALFDLMAVKRAALHQYLQDAFDRGTAISGIDPTMTFEVHSIRPSIRNGAEGTRHFQWNIELTQRVPQFLDQSELRQAGAAPDYYFRGGCTLIVDAETGKVRYSIKKPLNERRKERQRRYFVEEANQNLAATYFGGIASEENEPFAMLHRFGAEVPP
ncbi:MAG TPA: hypothetical protein VMO26_10665 [Vicinamibacterales bacterium]|nr:hypothetical protein [Vicinamibacterales bacterium]